MKQKQFDFKRVFPCFFLTLTLLTVPAFAVDAYVFPEKNCKGCGAAGVLDESRSYAPTCTNQGYALYEKCSCGVRFTATKLPALGHDQSETPVGATEPTCERPSYASYACIRCGQIVGGAEVGDPLGHDFRVSFHMPPTTYAPGYTIYLCNRCNLTERENIPQLPEPEPPSGGSMELSALLQTMTEVFSMACEWMEAVCFTVASHPILLLGVVIGFIGTGAGLFQRLLNL